jgi:type III pantothenate kinase
LNLIIDIGNTRTKLGIFGKEKLIRKAILEKSWGVKELQTSIAKRKIENVAVSTVAGLSEKTESFLKKYNFYLKLSASTPLPIKNTYETPETLGNDRLAVVIGAQYSYPEKGCLVIDAGTCITYDFISSKGVYHGGNITPGINMRLKAMHSFTANLPLVKRKKLLSPIGKDTNSSLLTGGQLGAILEMEGFINLYKAKFGLLNVILTGGDAEYFANKMKTKIFVNSNLVLIGLNQILKYNVQ